MWQVYIVERSSWWCEEYSTHAEALAAARRINTNPRTPAKYAYVRGPNGERL